MCVISDKKLTGFSFGDTRAPYSDLSGFRYAYNSPFSDEELEYAVDNGARVYSNDRDWKSVENWEDVEMSF